MLIGILSDSHDHLDHVRCAADLFKERQTDLVIHAGDMCSPPAIKALKGLKLAAVLGNNDGEVLGLARTFDKLGGQLEREVLELEVSGQRLAAYHGTSPSLKNALAQGGDYRYVICGHTHTPEDRMVGATRLLNPGTAHGFGVRATVMLLQTTTDTIELIDL